MLTVKYVDGETGLEFIVEADGFKREKRCDGNTQYIATKVPTILPDGTVDMGHMNCDYVATWCGDERIGSLNDDRIYVMNRTGATVAAYTFSKPDFSANQVGGVSEKSAA